MEMSPSTTGALIVEMRKVPNDREQQFYRAWHADIVKCPKCERETVNSFARVPVLEHFEPQAISRLTNEKAATKRVIFSYER
jgi:hypothetical protein